MNIRTDYLESLKRLEQSQKPSSVSGGEGFAAVFAQEIGRAEDMEALSSPAVRNATIDPSLFVNTLNETDTEETVSSADDATLLRMFTGQATDALHSWEEYAITLANGSTSRAAWSALDGLDGQVQALKKTLANFSQTEPELESVVNELEIMAATEKFKLNRGDYV